MKPLLCASILALGALGATAWFVLARAPAAEVDELAPIAPEPELHAAEPRPEELVDPSDVPLAASHAEGLEADAPTPSARVAEKQIFGRVLEESGAQGLLGFELALRAGNDVLARASTDSEGRFSFPLAARVDLQVAAAEREGWQVLEAVVLLTPEQARGEVEVVVRARSLRSAPIAGRVIDERTGAPLRRFFVRFEDVARRRADVVTDDEGSFRTSESLAAGDVRVFLLDHPDRRPRPEPRVVKHGLDGAATDALELSVASGPTFHVAFEPGLGPDLARMRLRLRAQGAEGSVQSEFEALRTPESVYCAAGEACWVRFAAFDPSVPKSDRIEARTSDGLWTGEAAVTAVKGAVSGVVSIRLEARAVVTGIVTDPGGAPVNDAVVSLRVEGRGSPRATRTDAQGRYRFEYLRPGSATIGVRTLLYAPADRDVELRSAERADLDVALAALPLVGSIRGRVTSDTGTYEPDVTLVLTREGQGGRDAPRSRVKPTWTTKDGQRVGTFDFGELPAGKHRVALSEDDWYEWEPRNAVVEAPRADLVFRVHDAPLVADLAIVVTDADNGLALRGCHLVLETFEEERMSWMKSGDTVLRRYPLDKRLRFRLDKEGYPPQFGDLSSFAAETLVGGRPRRTAEIAMSPGWGDQLRIQKRRDQKPLAGVTVLVDGREAGKSNDNGIVRIQARDAPTSVTLALEGWVQVGAVDLRPASERNWRRFNTAQMQPAPKKK